MSVYIARPFSTIAVEGVIESLSALATEAGLSSDQAAKVRRVTARANLLLNHYPRISHQAALAVAREAGEVIKEVGHHA